MKKLILICASLLCLSACSFFNINNFKNTAPNNFMCELDVGWFNKEKGTLEIVDNDVYINTFKKDYYNTSYFAHLKDGNYEYYTKDVLHNGEWESYTPVVPTFENMTTLDVITSLVGTISTLYYDIFNVEAINRVKSSGTEKVLYIKTDIYNVDSKTYWYYEGINMFLKIHNESEQELSCELTHYQSYKHFDDSPFFQ